MLIMKKYELFTCIVQEVFVAYVPHLVTWVEGLKNHFILIALMRNKYILHMY
jgi:hypothetical protein